jgi:hypothetical protein
MLIIIGSAIFVSSAILHIRKKAFETKFTELAKQRRQRQQLRSRRLTLSWSRSRGRTRDNREAAIASGAVRGQAIRDPSREVEYRASFTSPNEAIDGTEMRKLRTEGEETLDDNRNGHIRFQDPPPTIERMDSGQLSRSRRRTSFFEGRGVGARGLGNHPRHTQPVEYDSAIDDTPVEDEHNQQRQPAFKIEKYVQTINGYLGRNSQFYHLTHEERRKLGGIEYDAICLLSWVVPLYLVLWQLFGALGMGAWILVNRPGMARTNGKSLTVLL